MYFRPLKVKAEKGSDKISPAEFSLLFSNVEAIWRFHEMMLPALKTSPDGNVAAVLQAHADYLKMVAPSFGCSLCSASRQHAPRDCVERLSPARSSAFDR